MYDGRHREDVKEKDTREVRGELSRNEGAETWISGLIHNNKG